MRSSSDKNRAETGLRGLASIHRRTVSVMIVSYRDADLVLGRGCAAGLACR